MKGQIDEGFSEEDLEANLLRDKHARLCQLVNQIIDELTPSTPDFQLREACDQLVGITFLSFSLSLLTVLSITAGYIGRCPRDANSARFSARNAGYSRGAGSEVIVTRCNLQTSTNHQLGEFEDLILNGITDFGDMG